MKPPDLMQIDDYHFYVPAALPGAPTILHIGAYPGNCAHTLRARYPRARIIAVEVDPANLNGLRKRVAQDSVDVHTIAVGDHDGSALLYQCDNDTAHTIFNNERTDLPFRSKVPVKMRRFSTMCAQLGLSDIDLLLLNCEGAELYALQEICRGLAVRIGQMCVAWHCWAHHALYQRACRDDIIRSLCASYTIIDSPYRPIHWTLFVRKDLL